MVREIRAERPGGLPPPKSIEDHRRQCLQLIPQEHRADYTEYVLPALIQAGALKTDADWMTHTTNYCDSLQLIPQERRTYYTRYALPKLAQTGGLKTEQDWKNYRDGLTLISPEHRIDYTRYALPKLAQTGGLKTEQDWKNYRDGLTLIPQEQRASYTEYGLPELIQAGALKTEQDWKNYYDSLTLIPQERRTYYTRYALPKLIQAGAFPWEVVEEQLKTIREYTNKYGDLDFIWKTGSDNFGNLHPLDSRGRPLDFKKTGSELRVLDGHLSGVLLRTIRETAYNAWVKALEAGIPCEEILKYPQGHSKAGQYRAKPAGEGKIRVACLFGGPNLEEFLRNPENKTHEQEVHKQRDEIKRQLASNGITHGHAHDRNFTVQLINNKPIIRVIDFDLATSP